MKTKKVWILMGVLAVCLVGMVRSFAVDELTQAAMYQSLRERKQKPLVGLKALYPDVMLLGRLATPTDVNLAPVQQQAKIRLDLELQTYLEQQMTISIEPKLRLAGIRVISKYEYLKQPDYPFLAIYLDEYPNNRFDRDKNVQRRYYSSVNIELHEYVTLVRDPTISFSAPTWRDSAPVIYYSKKELEEKTREGINKAVDTFINDYLAANQP